MKEPVWKDATEEEVWKYVALHLAKEGIESILVGGSVVSVYTRGIYRSGDLDMVCASYSVRNEDLIPIMKKIGFQKRKAGRHFEHPECRHLFVEFLSPPVMISNDYRIEPSQIEIVRLCQVRMNNYKARRMESYWETASFIFNTIHSSFSF